MPQQVTDDLGRHRCLQKADGAGMPKGVWPTLTKKAYTGSLEAQANQQVQAGATTECSVRSLGMNKDLTGIGGRPSSSEVVHKVRISGHRGRRFRLIVDDVSA